jgi:hypothetical protein
MGFALPKNSSLAPRESPTAITSPLTSTHRQPAIPARREYRPIDAALAIAQTVCMVMPVKNEARNLPIVFRSLHGWIDEVVPADGRSVDDAVAVRYPVQRLVPRLQRVLVTVPASARPRLPRLRDRDHDETEFCIRITQRSPGSVFLFDNRSKIWHLVAPERCRFSYLRARCYAEGLPRPRD